MEIKHIFSDSDFKSLTKRKKTEYIILHHRAGNGDVLSIHNQHKKQGWSGIGYHYYVRKNGEVFSGRPKDCIGAQCQGKNSVSIGICFEGNFEIEKMSNVQYVSGVELIKQLEACYKNIPIKGHRELFSTACPGKNFPLTEFKVCYL